MLLRPGVCASSIFVEAKDELGSGTVVVHLMVGTILVNIDFFKMVIAEQQATGVNREVVEVRGMSGREMDVCTLVCRRQLAHSIA